MVRKKCHWYNSDKNKKCVMHIAANVRKIAFILLVVLVLLLHLVAFLTTSGKFLNILVNDYI